MIINLNDAASFLKEHDNFTIITHAHPDGDTLGSGFGLCLALRSMGKKANVINNEELPAKFRFLDVEKQDFEEQTVVAVDIADVSLMGEDTKARYGERVDLCIDHHGANRLFAKLSYVDSGAAAAAEIIAELVELLGVEMNADIADRLFTGVSTASSRTGKSAQTGAVSSERRCTWAKSAASAASASKASDASASFPAADDPKSRRKTAVQSRY